MASYTDTVPKFNPYVKQLPIEAMAEVGMYKQQKYDEGIQKIQTNIDNIAGLDVVRDVDKAYLQSKLNQLGNNLTTVAAGDFSNFQLVNSVNGMTNQISKDPNVLNAISSAKTYRKGLEDMAAANKDGKGSASNDWLFRTDASGWLDSQDVKKSFSGGYKPYTNYSKNALEVIKSLAKNETNRDVAIETDANGNTVVLDAITRTKIAGITPERIQSALMVGLSPNDFQQMQIDGRYNYSSASPEQFVSDINKSYKTDYDKYKQQRDILANSIDSTNSVLVKRKLQEQVASLDKSLNGISSEYGNITKSFATGDVESAKARLHTTKWMNNFSQTFANQETSQTYESSPFQQVKQFKETKKQDWNKFILGYNQDERFHQDDEHWKSEANKLAVKKEAREAAGEAGYGGVPFSVDQSTLPEVTLDKLRTDIAADEINIDKADTAIMKQFGKAGNAEWLDQQLKAWQNSPGSVDPLLAAHFNRTASTKRDILTNSAMITDISKQADDAYGEVYDNIPAGSKPVTINFPSGSYTYTPREMVDFNDKVKRYQKVTSGGSYGPGGGAPTISYDDAKAKSELSAKEYYLYKAQKEQKSPTQKTLMDNLRYYNTNVNMPFQKTIRDKNDFVAGEVKSRIMAMQGAEYGVALNNEAQKTSFGNALQGMADLADKQGGKLPYSPEMNTSTLREIAADVQNANVRIVEGTRYAPATYEITAATKGGTTQTFRVPAEVYRSVFGNRFEADPAIQAARPILNQMIRTGAGTTAIDGGVTTPANSFLGNLDFPNRQYYGVSGNVVQDQSSGLYSVRINLTDPITKEIVVKNLAYPSGGLIEENKIAPALQGLTDSKIFQMIYNRNPTAKELELIKQGSQNPQ
jgi:hypothetical protein